MRSSREIALAERAVAELELERRTVECQKRCCLSPGRPESTESGILEYRPAFVQRCDLIGEPQAAACWVLQGDGHVTFDTGLENYGRDVQHEVAVVYSPLVSG